MAPENPLLISRGRGFTIIELMIVVSVIAILVALAVPAYNNYAVRSKIAECINGAAIAKLHISEYQQIMGPWPPTLADAGLGSSAGSSRFCLGFSSATLGPGESADGSFFIDMNSTAIGYSGIVRPRLIPSNETSGFINWNCVNGTTDTANIKLLPSTCRDSVPVE
jgi:prepilin-type N-terminal cleavage/methylation domain-containing protein